MITKSMIGQYLKYIVPTMLTFTLAGVYSIVDGVFVGHAVGDAGLAGINVAYPMVAFIMAVGTGLGMGGGVVSSIARGAGDAEKAKRAEGTTFSVLACACVPIMALLLAAAQPLCYALGGRGETLSQAVSYIGVIAWGVPFQVLAVGCVPLIRNRGDVLYAMVLEVLSGLTNVGLDYVFVIVLNEGTAGAAAATVAAQALGFAFVTAYFARRRNRLPRAYLRPDVSLLPRMVKLGLAPFGLTLLPEVSVVAINMNLALYGDEQALAAYAVVSYTAYVVQALIQGVGDGSQPLVSVYYGANDHDAVRRLRNTNYLVAIGLGALGLGVLAAFRHQVPVLFGASAQTADMVAFVLPVFCTAYLFYGFTHTSTSYFYAVGDAKASNAIVYAEAALVAVVVFGLARLFGTDGVWVSLTTTQALLSVLAGIMLRRRHAARAHAEG